MIEPNSTPIRGFTPSDIEAVTGVSTGLQREWRRQKILPKKTDRGWTRIGLPELVGIFVLKKLADSGFPLREAQVAAGQAVEPVLNSIRSLSPDLAEWAKDVSNQPDSAGQEFNDLWANVQQKLDRAAFLVFSREDKRNESGPVHIIPISTLSELPDNLIMWTALDHKLAAQTIVDEVRKRAPADGERAI
ncbi:hypothetical protein MesoLj131b_08020 [Mesorhizobium sp. 131-2-5]|uniref:hypothetical protein n=1 Tax=Mesorhizobium sp. 131-2-5 TaxID=2744519 RepID=UPI0019280F46|nr:hypothetical protein [Mesorhizobium sp. 131-2-5]BCG98802.1 hypothetical protein MesoLj131b_08020 [Mesorhizobium sp. 131-2-5]